jgi:hypothetical protein
MINNRVIYSNDGTLTDYTSQLANYFSGNATISLVALEDAIFIGTRMPINSFFVKIDSTNKNSNSSIMTVSTWDGNNFRNAVDVIDETSVSGATLAQSGIVKFIPNKNYLFARESTNDSGEEVTGLTDVVIYDLFWTKLTFSADLSTNVQIDFIGNKFCTDYDLGVEYKELTRSSVLTAFESGKTSWEDVEVRASEKIIEDIISKGLIRDSGQLIVVEDLRLIAVQKVAEMIFNQLGDDYEDQRINARKEYERLLDKKSFVIDWNGNGILDIGEVPQVVQYQRPRLRRR